MLPRLPDLFFEFRCHVFQAVEEGDKVLSRIVFRIDRENSLYLTQSLLTD